MFSKENRYVTRGVNENIDIRLQLVMWELIDKLKERKDIDYLQVFKIRTTKEGIIIEHSQEVPEHKERYILDIKNIETFKKIKVFVIDDREHSTMLLAEEY